METIVTYERRKLQPGQVLSRGMAFVWYWTRLQQRGVPRETAREMAHLRASRYAKMTGIS